MPSVLGDLGFGHVGEVAQHQHLALAALQAPHGLDQLVALQLVVRALFRARHVGHRLGEQLEPEDAAAQRGAREVDDGLAQVGEGLLGVADPVARGVHADERLLDDVLAGGGVVQEQRGKAEQRPVVGAIGLGEVVDRGARGHRVVSALALRRQAGRAARHGRDHRHAAGRAGPGGAAAARLPPRPGADVDVQYLCHACWTRFPPSGLYAQAHRS